MLALQGICNIVDVTCDSYSDTRAYIDVYDISDTIYIIIYDVDSSTCDATDTNSSIFNSNSIIKTLLMLLHVIATALNMTPIEARH